MPAAQALPGWHGKLPTLGDFASRRLDRDFLDGWDGWLAEGMLALRAQLGDGWLDAYLASPSWRFLLMPGVLAGTPGAQVWAGVLMPSVDRVGRYFPFTLALPLDERLVSTRQMAGLWHWLARLDDLAADALQDDWGIERLEDELGRLAGPALQPQELPPHTRPAPGQLSEADPGVGLDPADWIGLEAHALWQRQAQGTAYWHAAAHGQAPRLLRSLGLPVPGQMSRLFGGPVGRPAPTGSGA